MRVEEAPARRTFLQNRVPVQGAALPGAPRPPREPQYQHSNFDCALFQGR
jgi:hypothetical protein